MPAETQTLERPQALGYESPRSHYRWMICALLFAVTTINYLDRQTLATLKPLLQGQLHFDEAAYGWMNFAFTAGYAIMYVFAGRFIDWMGTRKGLAIAVIVWSIACMGHSLVRGAIGFAVARFILAMGEAANFPAAIKTTAQWFPKKERALSTGLFNSGSNVGLMLTPLFAYLATHVGWQAAFILTGVLGVAWLVWWLVSYRVPESHPRVSAQELAYIQQDSDTGALEPLADLSGDDRADIPINPDRAPSLRPQVGGAQPADAPARSPRSDPPAKAKVPWTVLLRQRQAWPFLIGKLLTDPVWWFFLFWMPSYLHDIRHWSLMSSATSLLIPYTAASVGSIGGGWISSGLIKRGMSVAPARYIAMGICAICMPLSIYAAWAQQSWLAITLISLALAGHQGWSANIFTTATDMFASAVAGSVVGLGGTAGAVGGMLMTLLAGAVIQYTHHYAALFVWAGLMHPLSLLIYFATVGTSRTQADVAHQKHGLSAGLLIGGAVVALVGAAGIFLAWQNWDHLVASMKGLSGAAAGATAAVFITLIGLLLMYAGIDRRAYVPENE